MTRFDDTHSSFHTFRESGGANNSKFEDEATQIRMSRAFKSSEDKTATPVGMVSAEILLNGWKDGPSTAENFVAKASGGGSSSCDADFKRFEPGQDQLKTHVSSIENIRSAVGKLNTDVMGAVIAKGLSNGWDYAMKGSVQAAADIQHFVDLAATSGQTEILNKVYKNLDPHVAEQLQKAAQKHDTVTFE